MRAGNNHSFSCMAVNKENDNELRGRQRRGVHGIVVLITCRNLVVATIDDIGWEGATFSSEERLDAWQGVPVRMAVMIYEASTGRECFLDDEPGWIVSRELLTRGLDGSLRYRYAFRFFMLSRQHRLRLERYLREQNSGNAQPSL